MDGAAWNTVAETSRNCWLLWLFIWFLDKWNWGNRDPKCYHFHWEARTKIQSLPVTMPHASLLLVVTGLRLMKSKLRDGPYSLLHQGNWEYCHVSCIDLEGNNGMSAVQQIYEQTFKPEETWATGSLASIPGLPSPSLREEAEFPTGEIKRILWRQSCLVLTSSPLTLLISYPSPLCLLHSQAPCSCSGAGSSLCRALHPPPLLLSLLSGCPTSEDGTWARCCSAWAQLPDQGSNLRPPHCGADS